jgi:hypothetical protein
MAARISKQDLFIGIWPPIWSEQDCVMQLDFTD